MLSLQNDVLCIGFEIQRQDRLSDYSLTVPKSSAAEIAELLVQNGIKAIWNFAHLDLNVPKDVIVEHVHLSESLMRLSYNLTVAEQKEEK